MSEEKSLEPAGGKDKTHLFPLPRTMTSTVSHPNPIPCALLLENNGCTSGTGCANLSLCRKPSPRCQHIWHQLWCVLLSVVLSFSRALRLLSLSQVCLPSQMTQLMNDRKQLDCRQEGRLESLSGKTGLINYLETLEPDAFQNLEFSDFNKVIWCIYHLLCKILSGQSSPRNQACRYFLRKMYDNHPKCDQ